MLIEMIRRKSMTFRFDPRLMDAIAQAAKMNNQSTNRYIETLFMRHCQGLGILPMDFDALGETRGGDRSDKNEE
jgi:hypothetical protein